jgi:predicted phosphodiesterase
VGGVRTLEHLARPRTAGAAVELFAVEPDAVQLCWAQLPAGRWTVHVSPSRTAPVELDGGGAGNVVVAGLLPGTAHELELRGPTGTIRRRFRTPAAPPGAELFRFATISDLHLGRGAKHYAGPLARRGVDAVPPPGGDPQAAAAAAAIADALAWGAAALVVKGDICEETTEATWDLAADLLGDLPVPVHLLPGNHDTGRLRHFEPEVGAAARGLHLTRGVEHVDAPGVRIVLVDSTRPGNGWGAVARHAEEVAQLVAEADGGAFVATHHHAQRFRVPLFWPHGIPAPDASAFAGTVRAANADVLVSSGHTHRCRTRRVGGLTWSEVAATNHFPTVWAGYVVHEGGLRQTVRRISAPAVAEWSERTRHLLGGLWALWSTGTLDDRCVSLSWSARRAG